MPWNDLASNQMVSFTDAQGGGFTLQSGQSSVTSNQCMTKADATTKYVLDTSYLTSYASNQLIPKSAWVAGSTSGSITAILNKLPSGITASLTVRKNGAIFLQRTTTGTSTGTINTGDTFSGSQTGPTLAYRSLTVSSSRRGELFFGEREPGTPGTILSGTYTKEDNENITINGFADQT
jgi:hypothetical protein